MINTGINKHQVTYEWLNTCPLIPELFAIFSTGNNDETIFEPSDIVDSLSDDNTIIAKYIDGTLVRQYDFTIIMYLPYTTQGNTIDNLEYANKVQQIAVWIDEQFKAGNKPNFGDRIEIEKNEVINLSEGISARDENGAKYMFLVRFTYIDKTLKINF